MKRLGFPETSAIRNVLIRNFRFGAFPFFFSSGCAFGHIVWWVLELAYSSLSSISRGWGAINQIHPEMAHPFGACAETIASTSSGWRAITSEPCFINAEAYSFLSEMAHLIW
jgi:hypothetical protein